MPIIMSLTFWLLVMTRKAVALVMIGSLVIGVA